MFLAMGFDVRSIFMPSVGVDIVFNINSLSPYSRSSIIYDSDFKNSTITIAQPLRPFTKNTQFKELHLSTIVLNKNRKFRVGIVCEKYKLIQQYPLANNKTVAAVKIKYGLPVKEINIRSAYRLPLSSKFTIKGKITFQSLIYYTPRDFSIRDISLTGMGIVVPKKKGGALNPLVGLVRNDKIRFEIVLVNLDLSVPVGTLPVYAQVIRINQKHSESHSLIGLKFIKIKPDNQDLLNQFIHDAQVDELKRLSKRNL